MKSNQDYKKNALEALKGNWAPSVAATIVAYLVLFVSSSPLVVGNNSSAIPSLDFWTPFFMVGGSIGIILQLLVLYPMIVGLANSFKRLYINNDNKIVNNTFSIGFGRWGHNVFGFFLMEVFICLWALLFLVPGIIKAYSYAMTPYILADEPDLSANQAINKSRDMMKGHKFDLFCLQLSFIGWFILSMITCGIGLLWLIPYMHVAQAAFYADLKAEYETKHINI